VEAVNPARLALLRIVRIDRAQRLLTDGIEAQAMFEGEATRDGADEVTERIALYELSGQFFWSGFRLGQYGQSWKLNHLAAFYGGPSDAVVERTTPAEYEARVSSESALEPPRQGEIPRSVEFGTAGRVAQPTAYKCAQSFADAPLATPEATIHRYVKSLATSDLGCASQEFAAREHATRFDFKATVTWVRVLSPAILKAPSEYPMFVEMNELRALADMADASKLFIYGVLTDSAPMGSQPVESDAEIQAFIEAVNPARLALLRVVRIDQPSQSTINSPSARLHFTEMAAREGADEITERIALYEFSGRLYWSGFLLCRHGERWKIYEFRSSYGGPLGGEVVRRTTSAEYEARLR
jgi:hypothetical protein